MFFKGSRYLAVEEYGFPTGEGTETVTLKRGRRTRSLTGSFLYQVKEGDRLDLLAFKFYRTPRKWWLICDANPDLMHPDELLVPGRQLVIPPDQTT